MPQFVDIDSLSLSESLTGDETLQVSDTEKVSLNQIARLFLNQDVSSEVPVPTDSNMAFDASTTQNLLKYLSSAVLAGRARFFDMSNKLGVLEIGYSFGVALKSKTKDGVKYVIIFDMTTLTKPKINFYGASLNTVFMPWDEFMGYTEAQIRSNLSKFGTAVTISVPENIDWSDVWAVAPISSVTTPYSGYKRPDASDMNLGSLLAIALNYGGWRPDHSGSTSQERFRILCANCIADATFNDNPADYKTSYVTVFGFMFATTPFGTESTFSEKKVFVIVFNGYRKVCTPGRIACVSKPFTSWDDLGTTSDGNIFNDIRMDISGRSSSPEWTLEWQID